MDDRYPCGSLKRRQFLGAAALGPFAASILSSSSSAADEAQARVIGGTSHHGPKVESLGKLGAPGLYPGRVVEVKNPAMIRNGARSREAVKATLDRGLKELTGAPDATAAWRKFFEPGDVVGIKVVPNGQPYAHSSFELVLETIEGLKAAGVKTGDIFVYDRYLQEFLAAGYDKILPAGIRYGGLTPDGGDQLAVDFEGFRKDPVAGYDKDAFVWMDLVNYGEDPKDDRKFRSHLGKFLTKVVNKVVAIPVLKDHGSAGVTGALKNMSHGSVNNVARSHATTFTNVCNQFIPQVVSHPVIRSKFVLHIMDGIRGVYQGGPFAPEDSKGKWTWEYNALLLATDPVALDHIEWGIVDAKRALEKLPPVAASGKTALDPLGMEGFDVRQPQHIALAGALGLGNFDLKSSPRGRRYLVQHKVVEV
jgi:Domain of unknown function (DUF362)